MTKSDYFADHLVLFPTILRTIWHFFRLILPKSVVFPTNFGKKLVNRPKVRKIRLSSNYGLNHSCYQVRNSGLLVGEPTFCQNWSDFGRRSTDFGKISLPKSQMVGKMVGFYYWFADFFKFLTKKIFFKYNFSQKKFNLVFKKREVTHLLKMH